MNVEFTGYDQTPVISIDRVRVALAYDTHDKDVEIAEAIEAATRHVEAYMSTSYRQHKIAVYLDGINGLTYIPYGPTSLITLEYLEDGSYVEQDTDKYVFHPGNPMAIELLSGDLSYGKNAFRVRFTALDFISFGASRAEVQKACDPRIKRAIALIAGCIVEHAVDAPMAAEMTLAMRLLYPMRMSHVLEYGFIAPD